MFPLFANPGDSQYLAVLRSLHVNVGRFSAVAGKEEEPVRTAPENRRAHGLIVPAFLEPCYFASDPAVFVQPCRLTMKLIQIGAKGDVQPFDTG